MASRLSYIAVIEDLFLELLVVCTGLVCNGGNDELLCCSWLSVVCLAESNKREKGRKGQLKCHSTLLSLALFPPVFPPTLQLFPSTY